jgi:hypothetical protein
MKSVFRRIQPKAAVQPEKRIPIVYAFQISIALRKNDSRTNVICQTKPYVLTNARFRQLPLSSLRRSERTLTEAATDDALHLYHDFICFLS